MVSPVDLLILRTAETVRALGRQVTLGAIFDEVPTIKDLLLRVIKMSRLVPPLCLMIAGEVHVTFRGRQEIKAEDERLASAREDERMARIAENCSGRTDVPW